MKATVVLAGFHAVAARLERAPNTLRTVYVDERRRDGRMRDLLQRLDAAGIEIIAVDVGELRTMAGEARHQGVVAVAEVIAQPLTLDDVLATVDASTLLLVLDGVTDPRNLGACLRVADAAGVRAVIVPRDRSAPLTAVGSRAAAGADETVPLIAVTNLARALDQMRDAGVRVVGAAGEAAHSLFDIDLAGPLAWVLGAEGEGLRRLTRERCDLLAGIPLAGRVKSLNVSVATGICLFEAVRQRRAVGRASVRGLNSGSHSTPSHDRDSDSRPETDPPCAAHRRAERRRHLGGQRNSHLSRRADRTLGSP